MRAGGDSAQASGAFAAGSMDSDADAPRVLLQDLFAARLIGLGSAGNFLSSASPAARALEVCQR